MGTSASHFCALSAIYLRKGHAPKIRDLNCQNNLLRSLKNLGTTFLFKRKCYTNQYAVSIFVFADASRVVDHGQLGYVSGLQIGDLKQGAVLHTIDCNSYKSKRPVKYIRAY